MSGFRHSAQAPRPAALNRTMQAIVLIEVLKNFFALARLARTLQLFRQPIRTQERSMTLQFGQRQLVLELSESPFAWFHGQTGRMRLTSLSLLFVQFSVFARHPAA
jgi:type II secretory pathway component PulC